MRERVVVDPAAKRAGDVRKPKVPLEYGHADERGAGVWRATADVRERADVVAQRLGGWRRVGFAFGLAFALAGLVYGLSNPRQADSAAFCAVVGGLLLGFTVPLKGLDVPRQ